MKKLKTTLRQIVGVLSHFLPSLPRSRWGKRLLTGVLVLALFAVGTMRGIAYWYQGQINAQQRTLGASFIPSYASYFGLDPQQTLQAMLSDLHIRHLRLVSYWNEVETSPGTYDFSQLDWQFKQAEQAGAKITLSVGLRQPRWPECHPPNFYDTSQPRANWQPQLEKYMSAVIERYKTSPALEDYQVENEYFLKVFGECQNFDRQRLVDEVALVRRLDPNHKIVLSRSNNGLGTPYYAPKADVYGVSVYKRVWDAGLTHRYLEYPQPAWYYTFMGGVHRITQGKNLNVHELQAEAWAPNGKQLTEISLAEQNKSLNAKRLQARFEYGKATGLQRIDLWGAEYWYYRKQKLHDPSLWNVAQKEYQYDKYFNQ